MRQILILWEQVANLLQPKAMSTSHLLNTLGNALALLIVGWKTFYDVYWNKRKYEKAINSGINAITAAEQKRRRSDITITITFVGLAISYLILIVGGFYD